MKGLSWGACAIGNATWSGARLYDVLTSLGLKEDDPRAKHIQVYKTNERSFMGSLCYCKCYIVRYPPV